ncbi:sulfite exporter TauE/SafE family protein [Lysinibacillus fusiformis]|uniref:sulfite exporter TauE/SafE family protein n=1 Tax=Lysinibacillus fusiformis TaxID=28031 RepID=UPI0011A38D2E|nr:sulfite exporter TauE/SafE family protein [Lysinibacillus fusiformis]
MSEVLLHIHVWLSQLTNLVAEPIYTLALKLDVWGMKALLLGLVGATAPCQLTSNSSAIALTTYDTGKKRWLNVGSFITGKSLVYILLGIMFVFIGSTVADIPFVGTTIYQKILGPTLIVIGLAIFGNISLHSTISHRIFQKIQKGLKLKNTSFSFGVAMGFFFCPTLFWLFFGLLLPKENGDFNFIDPIFFAFGTAVPLIIYVILLTIGEQLLNLVKKSLYSFHNVTRNISAILFICSGLFETLNAWLG